jgi:hypothetical protein
MVNNRSCVVPKKAQYTHYSLLLPYCLGIKYVMCVCVCVCVCVYVCVYCTHVLRVLWTIWASIEEEAEATVINNHPPH